MRTNKGKIPSTLTTARLAVRSRGSLVGFMDSFHRQVREFLVTKFGLVPVSRRFATVNRVFHDILVEIQKC